MTTPTRPATAAEQSAPIDRAYLRAPKAPSVDELMVQAQAAALSALDSLLAAPRIDWQEAFDNRVSEHYPDDARSRIIAEAQAYLGRHPGCSPEGCVDEAIGAGRWR